MIANPSRPSLALALLTCLGFSSSAQGDPEPASERVPTERRQDEVAPPVRELPALLLTRLQALQLEHRKLRPQALDDPKAWAAGRAARAAQRRRELAQLWGNVVNSVDGRARLRMHAERMARLNRMQDVAEHAGDQALLARIRTDITRELVRHARAMQAAIAATGGQ